MPPLILSKLKAPRFEYQLTDESPVVSLDPTSIQKQLEPFAGVAGKGAECLTAIRAAFKLPVSEEEVSDGVCLLLLGHLQNFVEELELAKKTSGVGPNSSKPA